MKVVGLAVIVMLGLAIGLFSEKFLGHRKTNFILAFGIFGVVVHFLFQIIHGGVTFFNIFVLVFLLFYGVYIFLDAQKSSDRKCYYCGKHIIFWQKLVIVRDFVYPPEFCHKRCKK